jgi:hypothetical protein
MLGHYGYLTGDGMRCEDKALEVEKAIKEFLIELQEERGISFEDVYQGAFIGFSEYLVLHAGEYDALYSAYRYVEAAHGVACRSLENAFEKAKNERLN